jgi:hypothetical protein
VAFLAGIVKMLLRDLQKKLLEGDFLAFSPKDCWVRNFLIVNGNHKYVSNSGQMILFRLGSSRNIKMNPLLH